jgi:hypothetical protein
MNSSSTVSQRATALPTKDNFSYTEILTWLASRYDPVNGSFTEPHTDKILSTNFARGILNEFGLSDRLPQIVRLKLATWPKSTRTALASKACDTALATATREITDKWHDQLSPFVAAQGGYALVRNAERGELAAAYHIFVEFRPLWLKSQRKIANEVPEALVRVFCDRLLASAAA